MMNGVEVRDLTKRYRTRGGEVVALEGVSIDVPPGRMTAVVGPSGSGKTTLLYIVGSLEAPDAGSVRVGERDIFASGMNLVDYRRKTVGFVFQFFNLINTYTALENVMLPMAMTGMARAEQKRRAKELLGKMGIGPERWNHRPTRLSGGEQQRVAIARALANDPEIILADEPTGNLDSDTGKIIVEILKELSREGRCVIVATHDESVAELSDAVAHLMDGKLVDLD